jgi:valyl-tRNA synthetase
MSHDLPKAYDPSDIEERWAKYWVREHLFDVATPDAITAGRAKAQTGADKFVQLLPPPNVTGRLHMGHMLNQTEMDILTRWHRMLGDVSLWVPGTDHAGIATQMMVERQLASEGTSRQELGRKAFEKRVWKWKCVYGGAILDQMKRLGASVDWSREYFTMDARLSVAVKEAFVRLYEQGLIYRGAYIVNWDPVLRTAVSDLEVTHEERAGKLYLISYPLVDGSGAITVATTRPETMLGDVAVAVNPDDERYKALQGKLVRLPLSGVNGGPEREIPILADDWAKPEFGTGAVKVTPAHDPNDFAIGQRHNLPNVNILDETARVLLPGSPYNGLDRYAARERIVEDLRERGLLVEVKDHALSIGVSQRSGVAVEPRLSLQWFLSVNKSPASGGESIAQNAIDAVRDGHIRFTPEMYSKTYFEWMNNIHDWCISRQLWWGHQIPAWHCGACSGITVARETPKVCGQCGSAEIVQETDVLDTWFSSGLLPFTVFGWPNADASGAPSLTPDLAEFYPTQLLVTGFDILFFWVARMIMLGCHFMLDVPMDDGSKRTLADSVPFREVYIHALVRDAERQKMSKTKGNVIDPIDIINKFGTDAVRFTLASMASPGTDIAFSEERTDGYRAFANKIWNAARFLFMNVERAREAGVVIDLTMLADALKDIDSAPLETRWILAKLSGAAAEVDRALSQYRFDEAASAVYQFFWGDLCDWYIEIVKLRLEFGEGADLAASKSALTTLLAVFEAALRLLSPFMPFITEEIWHAFYDEAVPAKSIALTRFPRPEDMAFDEGSVYAMETMQQMIVAIRGLRKEMGVPEKEPAPVRVFADWQTAALAGGNIDLLRRLARVSEMEFASAALSGEGTRSTGGFDVAVIYERQIDVAAERERLTKDLAKFEKGLAAADKQLGNDAFMAKAPAHIVEGLRKQAAETKMLHDKAKAALEALPLE